MSRGVFFASERTRKYIGLDILRQMCICPVLCVGGGGARTLSLCNIVGDRQREGPLCQCGTPTVGFQNILIWSPPPPGPTSEGASLGKMSVPPGQPALLEKKSVSLQRDAHVWYHRVCILGPLGSHFFKVLWCYKSAEEMRVWDPLVAISSRCSGNTKEC